MNRDDAELDAAFREAHMRASHYKKGSTYDDHARSHRQRNKSKSRLAWDLVESETDFDRQSSSTSPRSTT